MPITTTAYANATSAGPTDDRCVLLPKKARIVLPPGTLDKAVGHLCTRFSATPTVVKRHLPREFEQWACVRIKGDDEVVCAASMKGRTGEDNRDASYVRVSTSTIHAASLLARSLTYHCIV